MLWQLVSSLFGIERVMHSIVRDALLSWHGYFVRKKRKKTWKATPLCLFWTNWKEKNRRAFENLEKGD